MKIGSNEKSDFRRKGKSPSAFRTISEVSEDTHIVIMSNGGFEGFHGQLIDSLPP